MGQNVRCPPCPSLPASAPQWPPPLLSRRGCLPLTLRGTTLPLVSGSLSFSQASAPLAPPVLGPLLSAPTRARAVYGLPTASQVSVLFLCSLNSQLLGPHIPTQPHARPPFIFQPTWLLAAPPRSAGSGQGHEQLPCHLVPGCVSAVPRPSSLRHFSISPLMPPPRFLLPHQPLLLPPNNGCSRLLSPLPPCLPPLAHDLAQSICSLTSAEPRMHVTHCPTLNTWILNLPPPPRCPPGFLTSTRCSNQNPKVLFMSSLSLILCPTSNPSDSSSKPISKPSVESAHFFLSPLRPSLRGTWGPCAPEQS